MGGEGSRESRCGAERRVVITIVTGASHAGKTKLAQAMLEQWSHPYLSIDHLKMGLIRSGQTDLTVEDDEALTEYLWPIVAEMIKTAIDNDQHLIIEGCYVSPRWEADFETGYLAHITCYCLVLTDAYIDTRLEEIRSHANDIETQLDTSYVTIDYLKRENRRYRDAFAGGAAHLLVVDDRYNIEVPTNPGGLVRVR